MITVSLLLLSVSSLGLLLHGLQLGLLWWHLRERPPEARDAAAHPRISVLKPCCGLDDELSFNLECFADLDYPDYELVLGVKDERDAAYPIVREAARRWPDRVRVVVQAGTPGLNPKVNQLIGLAAAARHDLLVVSDSNVRVDAGYLREIAAHLADPEVGLVTHPVAGFGERRLGSLLDSLHLSCDVGPGMVGAKRLCDKDFVVGKSMAMWRADLDRLGGFSVVRDVLAEDYYLGRMITGQLGKRVVIARRPVYNISASRSVSEFYARYCRWSVMHRQAVGTATYLCEPILNPLPLALCAFLACPGWATLDALGAVTLARMLLDGVAARQLRGVPYRARQLVWVWARDLTLLAAWVHGLLHRTIEWRKNRLVVLAGTRLAAAADAPAPAPAPAEALASGHS
jgi:ceramide glucosyltransferase